MDAGPPGAVLWDADGVLQTAAPGWRERLTAYGGEELVEDLFAAERPCLTGQRSFRDVVAEVVSARGLTADPSDIVACWERIDVDTRALSLVDEVRAGGVRCFLATNQQDVRRDVMRSRLPYAEHMDGAFYSCKLGVAKPAAAFFEAVLAFLDLEPAQVLLVDDSSANVAAARHFGLAAERHDPALGAEGLRSLVAGYGLP